MVVLPLYDTCYLGTVGSGTDGEPSPVYTYSETATRCAVVAPNEGEDSEGLQIPLGGCRIAFRLDSGIAAASRVKVTRRLRQTLATPEYYTVQGDPRRVRKRLIAVCARSNARDGR